MLIMCDKNKKSEVCGKLQTKGEQMRQCTGDRPCGDGETPKATSLLRDGGLPRSGEEHQEGQGRQKKIWADGECMEVMYCYYLSKPEKYGYRKRLIKIWKSRGNDASLTEQHLADQRASISRLGRFSMEILGQLEHTAKEMGEHQPSYLVAGACDDSFPVSNGLECLTDKQQKLKEKILEQWKLVDEIRNRLPPLKSVKRSDLRAIGHDINKVVGTIATANVTETNSLIYAAAVVATLELGLKVTNSEARCRKSKVQPWKMHLERKISDWRKDLSQLEEMKKQKITSSIKSRLMDKYRLWDRSISEAAEEIKQKVIATSKKIIRYQKRVQQFQVNKMFGTDQKRVFQQLEEGERIDVNEAPPVEDTIKFWQALWDKPVTHNHNAEWINEIEASCKRTHHQEKLVISVEMVSRQAAKMKNWKAAGPDQVHAFWLKELSTLHPRLAIQLQEVIEGRIPEWLGKGRTVLIMKDKEKGAIVDNYHPITCLPTTWKLMTSIIAEEMYTHLKKQSLLPIEQKGCRRNARGTKDHLLVDKLILSNCRRRKVDLHVSWIDYKKAYDSVPHSWILKCLELFRFDDRVAKFLQAAMKIWKTDLTINNMLIGECNIQRGIFQGDSLSPLLFVIAMIPLSRMLNKLRCGYQLEKDGQRISHLLYMDDLKLYGRTKAEIDSLTKCVYDVSKDIGMEFGITKCAAMMMKKGKIQESAGIILPDGQMMAGLKSTDSYKYLGMLQADTIKQTEMKHKVKQEYIKRVRKVLSSDLDAGNTVMAINVWAITAFRYSAGILDWTKAELKEIDIKTRKLLTIYKAHHPKASVARLYLPREEGGRGLKSIEQTVEEDKKGIVEYLVKSDEDILRKVVTEKIIKAEGNVDDYKKEMQTERLKEWKEKALHGQFLHDTEAIIYKQSTFQWIKCGKLKKETEGLLIAAQDQALRTNAIKTKIDHQEGSHLCRLCGQKEETVDHLVSSCSKIAQTDYKGRHDRVAANLHWSLCQQFGFPRADKWYDHRAEKVLENENYKLLWDFDIKTDKVIKERRPDLVIVKKQSREAWLIDVAIPGHARVAQKELEKKTKYQDLAIELQRLWDMRNVKVVPIIVGALGAVTPQLKRYLESIQIEDVRVDQIQRTAILGTAHILRRYLNM